MLPSFLQALDVNSSEPVQITIPDSTSSPTKCASLPCSPPRTCPSPPPSLRRRSASLSPQRPHHNDSNDSYSYLMCTENLSDDSTLLEGFDNDDCVMSPITRGTFDGKETSNSPTYSATDIFTTILDPDYEQNEKLDSHLSIMVSWWEARHSFRIVNIHFLYTINHIVKYSYSPEISLTDILLIIIIVQVLSNLSYASNSFVINNNCEIIKIFT